MRGLTTKIRYAARAMVDLGIHACDRRVAVWEVSKRQGISMKYLEALMPALKSAGLVKSVKGPRGGYSLGRLPEDITLYDIVAAFGGPVTLVDCEKNGAGCRRMESCAVNEVWREVSTVINEKLASVTLREIMERQRELDGRSGALVYYI
jgi:Rrf2 family protein